jgi:hypothetical protein
MNLKSGSLVVSALFILAACGGAGSPASTAPPPTSGAGTGGVASNAPVGSAPNGGGGGGTGARGYDCPTLLTPGELDEAAGLKGGTVTTTHRGDQPSAGEVPGVTECAIEIPTVSDWAGSFHVFTGDEALANFETEWQIAQQNGAVALAGVGGDALIVSTPELGVHGYARGAGVAIDIGVSWDDQSTTEQAVKNAVKEILATVLSRV